MTDIKKVKKGIECCICQGKTRGPCSTECPYETIEPDCWIVMNEDVLELLKEQQPRWISVTDRFPQDDDYVLVWVNGTYRDMAYRDEGVWYDEEHNHLKNITHWMPLPEPPKEDE